ncbi:hypothetical protein SIID45300_02712 [Candidatus Magnetaquicoccaceae bacterium FCR-1]|uniref:OmpA-like domain-containing protein n=1 Tax=Candidatus Magnetaquiglobus chichijimensis TaxID=3141448 RepID=A0ABQ0CBV3_9PROT
MTDTDEMGSTVTPRGPGWMMPLASTLAVLLGVCIMLLAMSRPDPARMAAALSSVRVSLGLDAMEFSFEGGQGGDSRTLIEAIEFTQAVELVRIKERLEAMRGRLADAKSLEARPIEEGFLIRMGRSTLFAEGTVTLRDEVRPVLTQLAAQFSRMPNVVRIDSFGEKSGSGGALGSVWALTAAEAAALGEFFVAGGMDPTRLAVSGHRPGEVLGTSPTERGKTAGIEILLTREIRPVAEKTEPSVAVQAPKPETPPSGGSH